MTYTTRRDIPRTPTYAAARTHFEQTKPWRGTDEVPFGGRRQRWCVLTRRDDNYHVTVDGVPILTYHPDNTITVTLTARHSRLDVIRAALPGVVAWGDTVPWLYLYDPAGMYLYADPTAYVVAADPKRRSIRLHAEPTGPSLLERVADPAHDLVGIPMFKADRTARNAQYAAAGIPDFAAWLRAYVTSQAQPVSTARYYRRTTKWAVTSGTTAEQRLAMVADQTQWQALAAPCLAVQDPTHGVAPLIRALQEDVQREMDAPTRVVAYQSLSRNMAHDAYQQRLAQARIGVYAGAPVPWADALPQPVVTAGNKA